MAAVYSRFGLACIYRGAAFRLSVLIALQYFRVSLFAPVVIVCSRSRLTSTVPFARRSLTSLRTRIPLSHGSLTSFRTRVPCSFCFFATEVFFLPSLFYCLLYIFSRCLFPCRKVRHMGVGRLVVDMSRLSDIRRRTVSRRINMTLRHILIQRGSKSCLRLARCW